MTDSSAKDSKKSADHGERPDLGRTDDHLAQTLEEALTGSNAGSDTRAGSLRGGSASGSDIDPDQRAIDAVLTTEGMDHGQDAEEGKDNPVNNTGRRRGGPGDDADASTTLPMIGSPTEATRNVRGS